MSRAVLRRLAGVAVLGGLLVAPATASADATRCAPGAGLSWARVQLFAGANCGGGQMAIKADDGAPDRANFGAFRNWDGKTYNVDNTRSSLILAGGTCVRLYDAPNFTGQESTNICATNGRLDWNLNRFDDRATSMKVCPTSTPDACGPGGSPPPSTQPAPAPAPRPEPSPPPAPPAGAVPPRSRYVALGDSYSSGLGTREYDLNRSCHRGSKAWPALVDLAMDTVMSFRACAGAIADDVMQNQVGAVTSSTRLVTISIGGNDSGFSKILIQCAKPWPTTCWGDIKKAERFVRDDLPARLDRVYTEIRRRAPRALVVVANYPRLFSGLDECNATRISPGEQRRLNAATDVLSDVIRRRVTRRANFRFADVRDAFAGKGVCGGEEWLNGLANPYTESYHPNVQGNRAYADVVLQTIRR